jgi:hypothetical protein
MIWFANQTASMTRSDARNPTVPAKTTARAAYGVTQESANVAPITAIARIIIQMRLATFVGSDESVPAGMRM